MAFLVALGVFVAVVLVGVVLFATGHIVLGSRRRPREPAVRARELDEVG